MCAVCELSWMKNLKGKDAVPQLSSTGAVFAFPRCDCGIWRWIGRPDCVSILFSSFTESELHRDPASFCCCCCKIVVVQWKATGWLQHFLLEDRYGPLWTCESVKRCKLFFKHAKNLLIVWKLSAWKGLQAILKMFKVNFVVVVVVVVVVTEEYLKLIISLNL